jgi:hypothetical protein
MKVARHRPRRGALLLEGMLALAIFVMMAIAILTMLERTTAGLRQTRDAARAADLARSAMAMLESGLATPRMLNGPVRSWVEAAERADPMAFGFGPTPRPHEAPWEIQIEIDPSPFEGLTHVSVHAYRRAGRNADQYVASYRLRQLVRLSGAADDEAGGQDALMEEARRGERDNREAPPQSGPRGGPRR